MNKLYKRFCAMLLTVCAVIPLNTYSATLKVSVVDDKGVRISDAVAYVKLSGPVKNIVTNNVRKEIDQRDKEFIPYVSVFKVGTPVYFPNFDKIRHHVYSFSPAKQFEIPLYKGTPADPIVFDKPGVVVLGCNIHDWMSAYVFITDSPFYSITDSNGNALIKQLPPGTYDVQVWHPKLNGDSKSTNQTINISENDAKSLIFNIKQKQVWRPFRAPTNTIGGYR